MIINDLDGYYIVFDTKNWNTELDTLINNSFHIAVWKYDMAKVHIKFQTNKKNCKKRITFFWNYLFKKATLPCSQNQAAQFHIIAPIMVSQIFYFQNGRLIPV